MAFSRAQVTMMEKMVTALLARCHALPVEASRPMQNCAWRTVSSWRRNRGTNRRVMLSTRDRAGITRPNRYTNLSDVMTRLKHTNHSTTAHSMVPAARPYRILSSVRGLPEGR